jgi:hypothetical protein
MEHVDDFINEIRNYDELFSDESTNQAKLGENWKEIVCKAKEEILKKMDKEMDDLISHMGRIFTLRTNIRNIMIRNGMQSKIEEWCRGFVIFSNRKRVKHNFDYFLNSFKLFLDTAFENAEDEQDLIGYIEQFEKEGCEFLFGEDTQEDHRFYFFLFYYNVKYHGRMNQIMYCVKEINKPSVDDKSGEDESDVHDDESDDE